MKEQISITTSPHERSKSETIKPVPQTEAEFYRIINNAGWQELKEYGFRKWDTMNNLISENIDTKDESKMVSIPAFNISSVEDIADIIVGAVNGEDLQPDSSMLVDLSTVIPRPTQLLDEDEWVMLFPGEWYGLIPDGFKCTGLWGQEEDFIKGGETDDDTRFGCLAYGIRRKIITK